MCNFLNDISSDVFNVFNVWKNHRNELKKAIEQTPMDENLFKFWKVNNEIDPVQKAVRYLFLSNLSLYNKGFTFKFNPGMHDKLILLDNIMNDCYFKFLNNSYFSNKDFRDFIGMFYNKNNSDSVFIYCDPPYLGTESYDDTFIEKDSFDLFECLEKTNLRWAMSEFEHPFISAQVKDRKLNVTEIGERKNIHNVKMELLITNYKVYSQISLI